MSRLPWPSRPLHGFEALGIDARQPCEAVDSCCAYPADEQPCVAGTIEGKFKAVQKCQLINAHPVARGNAAEPAPYWLYRKWPWRHRPSRQLTRPLAQHVRDVSW